MNIICPNRNLDEWKALVDGIGEERAYLSFFRSKNQIPTVEAARQLLGIEAPKLANPDLDEILRGTPTVVADDGTIVKGSDHGDAKERAEESGHPVTGHLGERSGWLYRGKNYLAKDVEVGEKPTPKPLTTLEALSQSKQVKVKLPEGANQLRITTSDGKRAIETIRNLNTGSNPFYGVQNITKVEAGVTGVSGANKGKFLPVKGEILVNPTASVSTEGESNEKPRLSPYMEADSGALAYRASEFIREVVGEAPRANGLLRHVNDGTAGAGAALDAIEKAFGRKILFMDFGPTARGVNGFIIPDIPSVIFLNTNSQRAPLVVVGHELFEHLKISNPELYEEIISSIGPMITGLSEWHEMLLKAYREKTKFTSPDIAHSKKELVANFIGDSFADPDFWNRVQEKNPSLFQKVGRIVLDWLNSLLAKLKGFGSYRFFNDIQAAHDVIARGLEKFSETAVSGGATQEPTLSVAVEPPTEPEGVEVHQIGGQQFSVLGTELMTPEEIATGKQRVVELFKDLELPGQPQRRNIFIIKPEEAFPGGYDAEGRQVIASLKKAIQTQNMPDADRAMAPLLVRAINYNLDALKAILSPGVFNELIGISAGKSSQAGQELALMQGRNSDEIADKVRSLNVNLVRALSPMVGGEELTEIFKRVMEEIGHNFTDAEVDKILSEQPKLEGVINKILTNAVKDQGGRVYLGAQQLLKPKSARKLSRMEADAKVAEAVQKIIEDAAKQGITPPEKKGSKLSPLQKLLLMIQPKTVEKLNALIGQAVKDAERNAGIRAALNAAPDEKTRNELEANFYAGEDPTPEQVEEGLNLQEFSHWRVIRDNILGYSPVTTKLASQVIPKVSALAKQLLATPNYRQPKMKSEFIESLVNQTGVSEEQAGEIWKALDETFGAKMTLAREKAIAAARKSMTPEEKVALPEKNDRLWKKIEGFFRAGGDDVGELIKQVAILRGYTIPTDTEVADLKRLADRIDRLQEVTEAERNRIQNDKMLTQPEKDKKIELRNNEEARINRSEIVTLSKKLLTKWAIFTKPFSSNPFKILPPFAWLNPSEAGKNTTAAAVEIVTANMLAKIGFPVRLLTHTQFQYLVLLVTRPPTLAWEQIMADAQAGRPMQIWKTVWDAQHGAFTELVKSWGPGLRQLRAQMIGRGDMRTMDRLLSGMNALERAHLAAQQQAEKGNYGRAALLHTLALLRYSLRVVGSLDAFQGEEVEFTEFRTQFMVEMAKAGIDRATAEMKWRDAFGDFKAEWARALIDVGRSFAERGKVASQTEMAEAADYLVKLRMYQKLELFKIDSDAKQAYILRQKLAQAWQSPPPASSVGGVVTKMMSALRGFAVKHNLPFLPMYFGQAIGNGINYHGRFLPYPLNKMFTGIVNKKGVGEHATNETDFDRKHNISMSLFGSLMGSIMAFLVFTGYLVVRQHYPKDKKKRDEFIAQGHKIGTVEWVHDDGTFTPHSMTVGGFSLFAPYLSAAGAAVDLANQRAEQQKKADEEAAKLGLPSKPIPHDWVADMLGVSGQAAWNTLLGGSTAAGLVSSYSEFGVPNAKKAAAAAISPMLPLVPMYQEISRMMGVAMDKNEATVFDYIVPLPTSQARMVNVLGDPVKTPDDIQRVIQAITAGSYPFSVNPNEAEQKGDPDTTAAYQALFASNFMPPAINPQQGHNINGVYRPFNAGELERFSVLRGQYLKQNLAQLGSQATPQEAKAAYQEASQRALGELGVVQAAPTRAAASPAKAGARGGVRKLSLRRSIRLSGAPKRVRGFGAVRISASKGRRSSVRGLRTRSLRVRTHKLSARLKLRKLRLAR